MMTVLDEYTEEEYQQLSSWWTVSTTTLSAKWPPAGP